MASVRQKCNSRLVYDAIYPDINYKVYHEYVLTELYWDAKEPISINALNPREKEVDMCMFVDRNYARDTVSYRSRSCFLICVSTALVYMFLEAVYN